MLRRKLRTVANGLDGDTFVRLVSPVTACQVRMRAVLLELAQPVDDSRLIEQPSFYFLLAS